MEDFVAWNHTKSGSFTVRSGYHVEWESAQKISNLGDQGPKHAVWDLIWKRHAPCESQNLHLESVAWGFSLSDCFG